MTRPRHEADKDLLDLFSAVSWESSVPVYMQIENLVRSAIASGRLGPGDQLPAVHELSERLKINVNTAAKAYRDLAVMGLLCARRGMGVFVSRGVEEQCREDCRSRVLKRLNEVVCEARAVGFGDKEIIDIVRKVLKLRAGHNGAFPAGLQPYLRRRK